MKKSILLLLIVSVFFACTGLASAAVIPDGGTVSPMANEGCILSFTKTSSTSAKAQARATRANASSITSTIQLQKKSGGSYVNVTKATKTVNNTNINHIKTFSISSGNTYRIKVTIKYTRSGITVSNNYYKTL